MKEWQRRLFGSVGICLLIYAGIMIFSTPAQTAVLTPAWPSYTPTPNDAALSTPTAIGINGQTHTVQSGDTLMSIANRYRVPLETLLAINGIQDPNLIYAGQVLVLPSIASPVVTATPPKSEPTPSATAPTSARIAPSVHAFYIVNGIPSEDIIILNDATIAHIRQIYSLGQALGRNPRAFSKLGDSTIENPFFLARFDGEDYQLGDYSGLQAVIDYYRGSFGRQSVAVRRGLHTWSVLDPMWATSPCLGGENMLACEFRIHNPSILFIRLGSNDAGVPRSTERHLRAILDFTLENGVIPIMGTKADRAEGAGNINNSIIRNLAEEYAIPLWDYDWVAGTLPSRGLDADSVHMTTFYAHDYTSPIAFQRGHSVHNLTALIALDRVWRSLELAVDSN